MFDAAKQAGALLLLGIALGGGTATWIVTAALGDVETVHKEHANKLQELRERQAAAAAASAIKDAEQDMHIAQMKERINEGAEAAEAAKRQINSVGRDVDRILVILQKER